MTLERITEKNIDYAIQIQEELFPGESGRTNFEESMDENSGYEYFLLYKDGTCVGVIGLYSYPEDNDSAWLGWFGIHLSEEDVAILRKEVFRSLEWAMQDRGSISTQEAERRICDRVPPHLCFAVHDLLYREGRKIVPVDGMRELLQELETVIVE